MSGEEEDPVRDALERALAAPTVRRGLRRRRPPVSVAIFIAPLPGAETRVAEALRAVSKATDVVGVLGSAAVAVVQPGTDDAGVRAYVGRVHARLPVATIVGVATDEGDTPGSDPEALLRAAWPAG